jgi:hypothetical protein
MRYHVQWRDDPFFVPLQCTADSKAEAKRVIAQLKAEGYSAHCWPCKPGRCTHRD